MSKPAILVVNKMDLPDAEEKLRELETQLENQEGKNVLNFNFCQVIQDCGKMMQLVFVFNSYNCYQNQL